MHKSRQWQGDETAERRLYDSESKCQNKTSKYYEKCQPQVEMLLSSGFFYPAVKTSKSKSWEEKNKTIQCRTIMMTTCQYDDDNTRLHTHLILPLSRVLYCQTYFSFRSVSHNVSRLVICLVYWLDPTVHREVRAETSHFVPCPVGPMCEALHMLRNILTCPTCAERRAAAKLGPACSQVRIHCVNYSQSFTESWMKHLFDTWLELMSIQISFFLRQTPKIGFSVTSYSKFQTSMLVTWRLIHPPSEALSAVHIYPHLPLYKEVGPINRSLCGSHFGQWSPR